MLFYSEKTKNFYKSMEECDKAEAELIAKEEAEKKKKKKLEEDKKIRGLEIENARKEMIKAEKVYNKLLQEYLKDYGTYSYHTSNASTEDLDKFLDDMFGGFLG